MKKLILLILPFYSLKGFSQNSEKEPTYTWVEDMPEFSDEGMGLEDYIKMHLYNSETAQNEGVKGRIYVKFVINKEGVVQDVAVEQGINDEIDKAAVEVLRNMPAWKPGEQDGEKVNVVYRMPIIFE